MMLKMALKFGFGMIFGRVRLLSKRDTPICF